MDHTENDKNKSGGRCLQLDGLRGFAIILVVLSHNSILNQGGVANALFFVLSGFLFLNPFKDGYEQRLLSPKGILNYYKGRALRILPAYYLVLAIIFIQTRFSVIAKTDLIKLMYFGIPYRHLWYLYALVRVLLIIPLVFIVLLLIAKKVKFLNNDLVCALIMFVIAGAIRRVLMHVEWYDIRFYQFLLGVCAAYLFRYIRTHVKISDAVKKCRIAGEILTVLAAGFIFVSSNVVLVKFFPDKSEFYIGWKHTFIVGVIMSLLVLLVSLYPDTLFGKLLGSKIMLFIGKLSLPIYLLNNFVIDQIPLENRFLRFAFVFSLCIVLGWVIDKVTGIFISLAGGKYFSRKSENGTNG